MIYRQGTHRSDSYRNATYLNDDYRNDAYRMRDNYLETEVLSADPVRFIGMLYRAAIDAVGSARHCLAAGAIRERSRKITKALSILHELLRSLDRDRGGEIARSLGGLYAYMSTRLIEANATQTDGGLAEVERLLKTLVEAWSKVPETEPSQESYEPVARSY